MPGSLVRVLHPALPFPAFHACWSLLTSAVSTPGHFLTCLVKSLAPGQVKTVLTLYPVSLFKNLDAVTHLTSLSFPVISAMDGGPCRALIKSLASWLFSSALDISQALNGGSMLLWWVQKYQVLFLCLGRASLWNFYVLICKNKHVLDSWVKFIVSQFCNVDGRSQDIVRVRAFWMSRGPVLCLSLSSCSLLQS